MAKSHPAFDLLDRYFQQNVLMPAPPAQGGTADGAMPTPGAKAVDPALAQQQAVQEVQRDGALIAMLLKAMGVPQAQSIGQPQANPNAS